MSLGWREFVCQMLIYGVSNPLHCVQIRLRRELLRKSRYHPIDVDVDHLGKRVTVKSG